MRTKEQLVAEVRQAMQQQQQPCFYEGACSYINPAGHRCAVGWLISEEAAERWQHELELGSLWAMTFEGRESLAKDLPEIKTEFDTLVKLQNCHDNCCISVSGREFLDQFDANLRKNGLI